MTSTSSHGKLRDLIALALLAAIAFACKIALSALPNIHLTAVILLLCVIMFGWRAVYAAAVYILLEGLVYGFGIWWIGYLICWPVLVALGLAVRKANSFVLYAVVGAISGFTFGALCAVPYIVLSGWRFAFAWWLAGIPYDLIHGVSNFVLCLLLLKPLSKLLQKVN